MPLDEATLKRHLVRANENLAARVKALDVRGVSAAHRRKDTKWRQLNAVCNDVRGRLKSAAAVKTRDEEVVKHKAEKLAAAVVEKEPKAHKEKKAAKEPKAVAKEKVKKADKGAEAKPKKKKE